MEGIEEMVECYCKEVSEIESENNQVSGLRMFPQALSWCAFSPQLPLLSHRAT